MTGCLEPFGIVLETAIVSVFTEDDCLITIVIKVEDFSEGGLGFVELEKIRRDLALLVYLGSDEAELFADGKEGQLIEVFILTLDFS